MTNLEDHLAKLKLKFKELQIPVFFTSDEIEAFIYDSELMSNEEVLSFIEQVKPSCILLSVFKFIIDEELTLKHVNEDFDADGYKDLLKTLKPLNNSIYRIEVFVSHNDLMLCFPFTHDKEEVMTDFYELQDDLEDMQEPPEEMEDGEEKVIPYRKMAKSEIESHAEKLLNDPDFIAIASAGPRREYLLDFFSGQLSFRNCLEVSGKVEVMLDKHIRKKVQELKAAGKKKVEVMSVLGISKGRIDKYY
jgi:hypothetical protein